MKSEISQLQGWLNKLGNKKAGEDAGFLAPKPPFWERPGFLIWSAGQLDPAVCPVLHQHALSCTVCRLFYLSWLSWLNFLLAQKLLSSVQDRCWYDEYVVSRCRLLRSTLLKILGLLNSKRSTTRAGGLSPGPVINFPIPSPLSGAIPSPCPRINSLLIADMLACNKETP